MRPASVEDLPVLIGATCSTHTGFSGATIAVEGATVLYDKGGPASFSTSAKATGSEGLATAFNVAPGLTKITVTHQGVATKHETNTVAGDLHWVYVTP